MNRAFTLVELMISLTLMVLMMLGVNLIFGSVGKATGAAQAISRIGRDAQASQIQLQQDFASFTAGPCLLISSQVQPAFRSKPDQLSAIDPSNPLIVEDGAGSLTQSAATIGMRSHRLDILSFFARGRFERKTGDDGQFVADMASNEAWIWYGHLNLPTNNTTTPTYMRAGTGTAQSNPNNFYSSQFTVGRVATALMEPDVPGRSGRVFDSNNASRHYMQRRTAAGQHSLAPLSQGTFADDDTKNYTARYDVAGTSIDGFGTSLDDFVRNDPSRLTWYRGMMLDDTDATLGIWRRYWANPFSVRWDNAAGKLQPISSETAAGLVPIFLTGASSFIVEFAGDYFVQDAQNNGLITAWGSDQEADYRIVNGARQTRWYGFPRDGNGDGKIVAADDVVPIRDTAATVNLSIPNYPPVAVGQIQQAWAERDMPTQAPDYAAPGAITSSSAYRVAWGPDTDLPRPSMIRIVILHDDPNGRLNQPQVSAYTFSLK